MRIESGGEQSLRAPQPASRDALVNESPVKNAQRKVYQKRRTAGTLTPPRSNVILMPRRIATSVGCPTPESVAEDFIKVAERFHEQARQVLKYTAGKLPRELRDQLDKVTGEESRQAIRMVYLASRIAAQDQIAPDGKLVDQ